MAKKEFQCPTCDGDLLLTGEESDGEEIFCPTCGAPSVIRGDLDSEACEVEADY